MLASFALLICDSVIFASALFISGLIRQEPTFPPNTMRFLIQSRQQLQDGEEASADRDRLSDGAKATHGCSAAPDGQEADRRGAETAERQSPPISRRTPTGVSGPQSGGWVRYAAEAGGTSGCQSGPKRVGGGQGGRTGAACQRR